tara:strand:+ start:218 stop:745 length:528 start_codon:yes stop_codon:yes gene_type:complete
MAIRTTSASEGGQYEPGWKEVTVKKASYGTWDDNKYIDVVFEELPENLNLRVYEAFSKKTNEEFAVAKFFKLANAGIVEEVVDHNGKKCIRFDDDTAGLKGKRMFIYVYKNEEGYSRVLREIAPIPQNVEGEVLSYSDKDTEYWQKRAIKYYNEYKKPANDEMTGTNSSSDGVPF